MLINWWTVCNIIWWTVCNIISIVNNSVDKKFDLHSSKQFEWGLSAMTSKKKNGRYSRGTCVKFVWATVGKKFWSIISWWSRKILNSNSQVWVFWSIISWWSRKIWNSNSQVWVQGITINVHKQILNDFQNNAILLFYQLANIHTCELEFDTFLLH